VSSPGPSKKLVFVALAGIVALAIVGIAIYMVQPSGETPTDAEPAAAPIATPATPEPTPAPTAEPTPTPAVEPTPVVEPAAASVVAQPKTDEPDVIEVDEAADHVVTDEPPPDPPADPPKGRGKLVKLRQPEPPSPAKKKVTRHAKRPKSQPATKWDPNGLFPEKK
jgi:hypothetical protein